MAVSELTMAELRYRHAYLVQRAETERQRWRGMINTSPSALAAGRRVTDLQRRADEYGKIVNVIQNMDLDQVLEVINGG